MDNFPDFRVGPGTQFPDLSGQGFEFPNVTAPASSFPDLGGGLSIFDQIGSTLSALYQQGVQAKAVPKPAAAPPGATSGVVPGDVPETLKPVVQQAARQYGVDPALLTAVMRQESMNFNPQVLAGQRDSPAGAIGPMQLMPATAAGLNVNPRDPTQNILGGARYLSQLLKQYGGDETLALIAYNGGPGAVSAYQAGNPYTETQQYLATVPAYARQYRSQNVQGPSMAEAGMVGGHPWTIAFDFDQPYGAAQWQGGPSRHRGVDLQITGAPDGGRGQPVLAFRPGTVVNSGAMDAAGGNGVIVRGYDGLYYRYFHFDNVAPLAPGTPVDTSTVLGRLGSTGSDGFPHLHFEVSRRPNGDPIGQLIDPRPYMNPGGP